MKEREGTNFFAGDKKGVAYRRKNQQLRLFMCNFFRLFFSFSLVEERKIHTNQKRTLKHKQVSRQARERTKELINEEAKKKKMPAGSASIDSSSSSSPTAIVFFSLFCFC